MSSNIIIGLPSGQVFNCNSDCKYELYSMNLAKYFVLYNGLTINEYVFLDKNTKKVKRTIIKSFKLGTKIYHSKFGDGEIVGIFDDGWIVGFRNPKKKLFTDNSMLMEDLRFELL